MLDFLYIKETTRNNIIEIRPDFYYGDVKDIMTRGGKFYAIWDEEKGMWSTNENDVQRLVDKELWDYVKQKGYSQGYVVKTLQKHSNKSWKDYKDYVRDRTPEYVKLDRKVTFSNTVVTKEDYVSKRLSYPLEDGPHESYEKLISTLYDPKERAKIEWAIGSIVAGDSIDIQKFLVFYGKPGSGKSTILDIIDKLFAGYSTSFSSKSLGNSSNQFSAEAFRNGPLVAIEQDGDLSKIEDNTKLNSIVSHEKMLMNVKHQSAFTERMECMLFMGTNKEVKITDAKSGILRRLIDVHPSNRILPIDEYESLVAQIPFELSGIAWHCLNTYKKMGKSYYLSYRPFDMLYKSNAFYNFVDYSYDIFAKEDCVTLKTAWERYNTYFELASLSKKMQMYAFREELKNYFDEFKEVARIDGRQYRSVYFGFKKDLFDYEDYEKEESPSASSNWLVFDCDTSIFDKMYANCKAQYSTKDGKPKKAWNNVKTTLKDILTTKLHYVKVPENVIVIDLDIKDEEGNKSFKKNYEAANKFPKTYAEVSQSGEAIHLHYIYTGDVNELSHLYSKDIEIKIFTGGSALRRKLTKCNDIPIAQINSGLPKKETKKMINVEAVRNEQQLRSMIQKCLNKKYEETMPSTTQNINFIAHLLEESYNSGTISYDIRDMKNDVKNFAQNSTHQKDKCFKTFMKMHFCSSDIEEKEKNLEGDFNLDIPGEDNRPIAFYDIEVFRNLFIIAYKVQGTEKGVFIINPTKQQILDIIESYRLIGFNNNRYDDHIIYGRIIGEENLESFERSQRIIVDKDKTAFFSRAKEVSYLDVYDASSKKMSLKKWEAELDLEHDEVDIAWDSEVPEDRWVEVAEYCLNDVNATEAVYNHITPDLKARYILAALAGMNVNNSTNTLTTKIIVGNDKNPQTKYRYVNLSETFHGYEFDPYGIDKNRYLKDEKGNPIFVQGKSIYRGEDPGEGGYVYAEPGIYGNVALLDIASMHPTSAIVMKIFGEDYTKNFEELYKARLAIKHEDYETAKTLFGGKLAPFLNDTEKADELAYALKIAINSVYGLTSAKFPNKLRDPRNIDNIVAKRGALFMIDLKHAVQEKGYKVAHIKTDSIKIPDATPEIIQFVMDFGKKYGYSFEHEATYDKMCLVNDAVYIARYSKDEKINGKKHAGKWTATGAQFQHPYVFKYLFSKEPIEFKDMCEIKTVQTALYLDMNENLPDGEHNYVFVGKVGTFCPIKEGAGGGLLMRKQGDKFNFATGSKGFRWLESERVKYYGKEDDIDTGYFRKLVDEAISSIGKYGDFYEFSSDDPYVFVKKQESVVPEFIDITSDELPF